MFYAFGEFRVDLRARRLLRGDEALPITVKAFDTLAALLEHAGEVVDKDQLMRRVWPDAVVEDANLSQQIFLLRKTLGEDPKNHRFIQTVPRRGFRFVAPVVRIEDEPPAPGAAAGVPPAAATAGAKRLTLSLAPGPPLALAATTPFAVSPDGRTFAWAGRDAGGSALYVRPLDRLEAARLDRTDGASGPFFSPDSRWIGFFAGGRLHRILAAGGAPIAICDAGGECRGAAWTTADEIVFAPTPASGLVVVPADGGTPRPATTLEFASGERTHRWPDALPDGAHLLVTIARAGSASFDDAQIALARIGGGERRVLVAHGSCARYVPTGHLVYMRGGSMMAVAFDPERLETRGAAIPVADHVMTQSTGAGHFGFSHDGVLLYLTGDAHDVRRRLVWVRDGDIDPVRVAEQAIEEPRLSPDGRRVAFGVRGATNDIWIHALDRRTTARATFEGDNFAPIWTPDGARLTFSSNRHGPCHIFWQDADGGDAAKIVGGDYDLVAGSWSPDGAVLLFTEYNPRTGACIWMCTPRGGRPPKAIVRSRGNDFAPALAPDGRSFAYTSDESGRFEIYVSPFPDFGAKAQISDDGGAEPVWSRDGRRLYYRNGSSVMVVEIDPATRARVGEARRVVDGPYQPGAIAGLPNYDVAADGALLLIAQTAEQAQPDRLSVTVNWFADIAARLGG